MSKKKEEAKGSKFGLSVEKVPKPESTRESKYDDMIKELKAEVDKVRKELAGEWFKVNLGDRNAKAMYVALHDRAEKQGLKAHVIKGEFYLSTEKKET
jgi:hypothetical protein